MKKLLVAFAAVAAFSAHADTLTVAATPVPHAEILEFVKPALAKEGVDLKVKVFTDYIPVSYTHLTLPTSDLV